MDLTPLLGPRTGIGLVVQEVADRLGGRADVRPTGVRISWRGREQFAEVLGDGWRSKTFAFPARLARHLWFRSDRPRITGFDVVHGLNYVVPPAGGGAELVAVHDLTAWHHPQLVDRWSAQNPVLLQRALGRGAHVHTGSRFVAEELVHGLGIDPDRVHTLRYAHSPGPTGDGERGRAFAGIGDYVLAVGTIEPRKDYVGLMEAMADVWSEQPGLALVIAGRPAWGSDALAEAIRRCPRPDLVVRPGYVDDQAKADLLAGARALVYPSVYEGFGFPLLEAMAAGVPVVSTTAGSIPEVAGDAALLVGPGDREALTRSILAVVADDAVSRRLVAAGRSRLDEFSWDDTVDELVSLYHRLAGR